ncbi:hypothetical protein PCANC_14132 [Puccinia coronata f. sp. avenae]|uniref:BED-type domain-containing protein n=1 Tax=Puccinia coronata f. sp. avenae TaxID=200324 RepID=A0A2N5SVN7_9BASI|nr:hypothetical protein PCANC_14132 [Puccinia coronata f. sp. avenae]
MQKPKASKRPQPPSSTNSDRSENEPISKKTKQSQTTATSPAKSEVEIQITGKTITNTPATSTQNNPMVATATPKINNSATTTTKATVSKGSENPRKKIQSQHKATSKIWKHFKDKGKGENKVANYQYCQQEMCAKPSGGTKSLWRHLDQCGCYQSKTKQALLKMPPNSQDSPSTWIFSQKESCDLLTKLIIADEKPFTLVEHPIFKAFISSLQPKFKLYGRTTIKKDILNM